MNIFFMQEATSTRMSEKKISFKKENTPSDIRLIVSGVILGIAFLIGGVAYWNTTSHRVYIEKGEISAPQINLSSQSDGVLEALWVKEGDVVAKNQPIAQIGDEIIRSREDGLVVKARNEIGKTFSHSESVVSIIHPADLRVFGTIEEDKGLKDIHVGQRVVFTVDAFGSKEYEGIVDEVSPSSKEKGLAFSISDKRPTNTFVVKVRFSTTTHTELKNGMSAEIWVYQE